MVCSTFEYSNHAVAQMFRRGISADEVEAAYNLERPSKTTRKTHLIRAS